MKSLVLVHYEDEIHLYGAGIAAPVRGAKRMKRTRRENGWVEEVEVYFEGLPGAIRDRQAEIERMLAQEGTRLRLEAFTGAEAVEARLERGTCEPAAWNSGDGTAALRLQLARAEAWQGAETVLPLSNPGGTGGSGGLVIYGHSDGSHWNYADIAGDSLAGSHPGAARLELENAGTTESLTSVIICVDAGEDPNQSGFMLEGEAASGGSRVTPAGCSGGAAQQVSATSTSGALLAWTLEPGLLERLAGRTVRPAARMAAPAAAGKVWVWWQVRSGPTVIWTSERDLLAGEALEELPALPLPPQALDNPSGLALELCGKTTGGTVTFSVDFVQFCPLDGWRRYRAAAPLPPGGTLVDDGVERRVYARTAAGETSGMSAAGAPLRLHPGRSQRVYVLHGGSADVPLRIKITHRPAWENL